MFTGLLPHTSILRLENSGQNLFPPKSIYFANFNLFQTYLAGTLRLKVEYYLSDTPSRYVANRETRGRQWDQKEPWKRSALLLKCFFRHYCCLKAPVMGVIMHRSHSNNVLLSELLPWVNRRAAVYFGLQSLAQDYVERGWCRRGST